MSEDPPQPDPSLPPKLSEGLAALYKQKVNLPETFDKTILRKSRAQLTRRHFLPWAAIITTAAAAMIAIVVWHSGRTPTPPLAPSRFALGAPPQPGEKITILPAFKLAKAIKEGITPSSKWDKLGDGKIDQRDVDAWAASAVQIDAGAAQ